MRADDGKERAAMTKRLACGPALNNTERSTTTAVSKIAIAKSAGASRRASNTKLAALTVAWTTCAADVMAIRRMSTSARDSDDLMSATRRDGSRLRPA